MRSISSSRKPGLMGRLRQRLPSCSVTGKSPRTVAEVREDGLQVERHDVVGHRRDSLLAKACLQGVAVLRLDGVLRPYGGVGVRHGRCDDRGSLESFSKAVGDLLPALDLPLEVVELGQHHGGLHRVEAAVDANAG